MARVLRELRRQGYWFRLHRFRVNGSSFIYLKARRKVNGRVEEVSVARVEEKHLEEIKRLIREVMDNHSPGRKTKDSTRKKPVHKTPSNKKENSKASLNAGARASTIINSSSKPVPQAQVQEWRNNGGRGGVGGSARASVQVLGSAGSAGSLFVHRVVLRFVRPWVSPLYLSEFKPVYVGRSRQWVVRLEVGDRRRVTVQVNRDGSAQVFLEASDNPLGLEEFIGFCRFYLLWLFREITGKNVSLEDFIVLSAPEFNLDLDGVNLLEGLNAKSLTLEKYLSDIVRIYYSDPGVKATMPNGGTRVETRPSSYEGVNLRELVEGVAAAAELPRFLSSLKKEVEEVKELVRGGVSLKGLEKQGFADLVATRLANYLEILWKRIEARLQQWIRELAGRIAEAVQGYIDELLQRIRILEEENKRLRKRIRELESRPWTADKIEECRRHPGWGKLLELATPGPDHPALVNIDLEKGMVYYSPELWRYIRSRTGNGTIRGLDKQLLDKVRDYHGERAVKLLRTMQMHGGKIGLWNALTVLGGGSDTFKLSP